MRYAEEEKLEEIYRLLGFVGVTLQQHKILLGTHTTGIKGNQKAMEELRRCFPEPVEFIHRSREHKEMQYLIILNDLHVLVEATLDSFDDLAQRLVCFCEVQEKARAFFKTVDHLDQRKDARKQIALYIRDAVLNVYAEDLEKKNLESLLNVLSIARKEDLNSSDRRQVVRLLYKGGWHPYPNLKKGLSEVIAENE